MFKKVLVVLLVLVLVTAGFAGCKKKEENKLIGLSMHFMQDDYAVNLVDAFKKTLEANGYMVEETDAGGDPQKQLNDVQALVSKKVAALVIVPMDEKAVKDACNEAANSGIPVISVTHMPGADVATEIKGGDYENGFGAGELLVEALGGEGEILVLDASVELFRIQERLRGFEDAIEGTNIKVVETKKMLSPEEAMAAVQNVLTANPEIDGIFGTFGSLIYGAGSALKSIERSDIAVTGIDADISILNLINEGYITGAAAQFPEEHGTLAAEAVIKVLSGENPDKEVDVPFKMATKDNCKEMAQLLWDKTIE